MGNVVTRVPIKFNPDGSVLETATLLSQYQQMNLKDLQRAAQARFNAPLAAGTAIPAPPFRMLTLDPGNNDDHKKQFYSQVHSNVVAHIIKNGLSTSGYNNLLLQKEKFTYYLTNGKALAVSED